jgi:predicted Fe-Mo cluster-binding NifX family protein
MDIKIAVASSDGKNIDLHFGRAHQFLVFIVEKDGYRYLETRKNVPACDGHSHDDDHLEAAATLLGDCQGVIVNQIGPGAVDVLIANRILPFAISGNLDEGLRIVISSPRLRYMRKRGDNNTSEGH